jgi:deoxyribodipyrimidine photo-lyase
VKPDERTTVLQAGERNPKARYVLYWMQVFKRASHNQALNAAIRLANELKLPLVVYEGLKYYYPWANDRIHTFILEGVNEKRAEFARRGIRYLFYLQRDARDPKNTVARLAKEAAAIVTDDFPCFIVPEHNRRICEQVSIPVYAVDANGVIPLSALTKEEWAARTIRPKIKRLLPERIEPVPNAALTVRHPRLRVDCPETKFNDAEIPRLVAECDIDHTVPPSPLYRGGSQAGRERLRLFVRQILPHYDNLRNEPSVDGTSRLSAYLHFGFLSVQEIAAAVQQAKAPAPAKAAYLEELMIRRELSFNLTRFNPNYDSLEALPPWVQTTMREHRDDQRETVAEAKIEAAETYDELWNATERELVQTGALHNYVRMLWGKKIMEWRATYEQSFTLMEHLNNKYALDGRDPNSYAGILWCFGKHDRAWGPERPIFGKMRYMASPSMTRKIDAKAYIAWTKSLTDNPALPPTAKTEKGKSGKRF